MRMITRGKAGSTVRAAAYRSGSELNQAAAYRSGERIEGASVVHDYSMKRGVLETEIMGPDHMPERLRDRATLWNEVDRSEKRKDAQLARDFLFPFQRELTFEQNREMVRSFVRHRFVAHGEIADICIHDEARGNNNLHAHVMVTTRPVLDDGTFGKKDLSRRGPAWLHAEQEAWRDHVNGTFERFGIDVRLGAKERTAESVTLRNHFAEDRHEAGIEVSPRHAFRDGWRRFEAERGTALSNCDRAYFAFRREVAAVGKELAPLVKDSLEGAGYAVARAIGIRASNMSPGDAIALGVHQFLFGPGAADIASRQQDYRGELSFPLAFPTLGEF